MATQVQLDNKEVKYSITASLLLLSLSINVECTVNCRLTWRRRDNLPSSVIHSTTTVPESSSPLFNLMSIDPSPSSISRGTNVSAMFIVPSPAMKCNYRALLFILQIRMRLAGFLSFEFVVYRQVMTSPLSAALNTKKMWLPLHQPRRLEIPFCNLLAPTYWSYSELIIKKSAGLTAM